MKTSVFVPTILGIFVAALFAFWPTTYIFYPAENDKLYRTNDGYTLDLEMFVNPQDFDLSPNCERVISSQGGDGESFVEVNDLWYDGNSIYTETDYFKRSDIVQFTGATFGPDNQTFVVVGQTETEKILFISDGMWGAFPIYTLEKGMSVSQIRWNGVEQVALELEDTSLSADIFTYKLITSEGSADMNLTDFWALPLTTEEYNGKIPAMAIGKPKSCLVYPLDFSKFFK